MATTVCMCEQISYKIASDKFGVNIDMHYGDAWFGTNLLGIPKTGIDNW